MIVFDSLNHSYTEGEVSLPSVTTVLKAEGFYDPRVFKEGAANRGTLIHLMTQQVDEGTKRLEDFNLNPLYGYVLAWDKFKTDIGAEILDCEIIVGGTDQGCAGKPGTCPYPSGTRTSAVPVCPVDICTPPTESHAKPSALRF